MSPRSLTRPASDAVRATLDRVWAGFGTQIRDARLIRRWSTRRLADEAGLSRSLVYLAERGEPISAEAAVRLTLALGLRLELDVVDPRRRPALAPRRAEDPVHAAMAELEARHLRRLGFTVAIDEPYQHYQFAGRADVLAWDVSVRSLLHLENRTRFPNLGEIAGSWNAKRAYLAGVIANRLGLGRGFGSVTHTMVALWSAEVLHVLRLRTETFRSLCPDANDAFAGWWRGQPPERGEWSALIVLDPSASGRERQFLGLEEALGARPRVRGYADAVARLDLPTRGSARTD